MTSLQNHPRPKWKSRSFWSCFEAPFIPLFWGVKIPYMNRMGPILVRSFWKELSTILKILKCNNLRFSFLEENLRWKLVIYCIYKLFRSKVYCWVNVSSATNTVKILHNPSPPPQLNTPPSPHSTKPIIIPYHSPTNYPTQHLFRVSAALLGINANTEAIQSACLADGGFQGRFGCPGL